jgi:hypothetical protein
MGGKSNSPTCGALGCVSRTCHAQRTSTWQPRASSNSKPHRCTYHDEEATLPCSKRIVRVVLEYDDLDQSGSKKDAVE